MLAVLALLAWRSFAVIAAERQVALAEARLTTQRALAEGGVAMHLPPTEHLPFGVPPRVRLIQANLLAEAAAQETKDARRSAQLLEQAREEAQAAVSARPVWGDAWMMLAFIESQRLGAGHRDSLAALARSYVDAPYLRSAALWRVRTGLAQWDALDGETRRRVVDEAVWLTRIDEAKRNQVFSLARQSPAYRDVLLRWRTFRLRDADYRGGERFAP